MALTSDGHLLVTGDMDGSVRAWDSRSGQTLVVLESHAGEVSAVALSADGQVVASGGQDGTVRLWDAGSGRSLVVLEGRIGEVWVWR